MISARLRRQQKQPQQKQPSCRVSAGAQAAADDLNKRRRIANDATSGIAGHVQGERLRPQMRAGRIYLNGAPLTAASRLVATNDSGNGREHGIFGSGNILG
jgi:hypothetical protein